MTATFGLQHARSAYFRAMRDVGALREGAQAVFHTGVDFGLRPLSPVLAVADGSVVSYTYSHRLGNYLVLRKDHPAGRAGTPWRGRTCTLRFYAQGSRLIRCRSWQQTGP